MAKKRMFDIEIINQDSFYDLPMEAKALYFLLGMEADDEGFITPRKILRLYGGTDDSVKILIAKGYLIPFESGVVVITDWKRNNYLDRNRITPTIYQEEKKLLKYNEETQKYALTVDMSVLNKCLTDVKQTLNQKSREEKSIEEYRREEKSTEENSNMSKASFDELVQIYNSTCTNLSTVKIKTEKRVALINKFNKQFKDESIEKWQEICDIANNNKFLCGLSNSKEHKNWKANFDWLINIDNATKVLEGKYDENPINSMSKGLQNLVEISMEIGDD